MCRRQGNGYQKAIPPSTPAVAASVAGTRQWITVSHRRHWLCGIRRRTARLQARQLSDQALRDGRVRRYLSFHVACLIGFLSGSVTAQEVIKKPSANAEKQSAGTSGAASRTKPFGGKPQVIPGTIEAEHYDDGPAELAYHDVDAKNHGAPLRGETQVDIEARGDASGGHGIGWTKAGEWLVYTVDVKEAGIYMIEIPAASQKQGGIFHLEFNGVDRTGALEVPDTGSWQKLQLITRRGIKLERGVQLMKIVMDRDGASHSIGDIDLFRFKRE